MLNAMVNGHTTQLYSGGVHLQVPLPLLLYPQSISAPYLTSLPRGITDPREIRLALTAHIPQSSLSSYTA